jgi:hypothetical protein
MSQTRPPTRIRPDTARRRHLEWIPIRHGELPLEIDRGEQGPDLGWTAGGVAGLLAGFVGWRITGSVALAVFWFAVAAEAVRILVAAPRGDGFVRHVAVLAVAGAVAVGTLLLALSLWETAWYSIAVALVCGAVARGLAAWVVAPSLIDTP